MFLPARVDGSEWCKWSTVPTCGERPQSDFHSPLKLVPSYFCGSSNVESIVKSPCHLVVIHNYFSPHLIPLATCLCCGKHNFLNMTLIMSVVILHKRSWQLLHKWNFSYGYQMKKMPCSWVSKVVPLLALPRGFVIYSYTPPLWPENHDFKKLCSI